MKKLLSILTFCLLSSIHPSVFAIENAEGVVYCHKKTVVEFMLVNPDKDGRSNDVDLTINGKTKRYMTAYSWYGSAQKPPKGFKYAILGEGRFDPLLVFDGYLLDKYKAKYKQCN